MDALRDLSGGHWKDSCRSYLAWRVLKGDVSEDDVYKYLDGSGLVAGYPGLVPYFFYTLHASYWNGSIGVQYRNTCSQKHDDIIKVNVYRGWKNKVTYKV